MVAILDQINSTRLVHYEFASRSIMGCYGLALQTRPILAVHRVSFRWLGPRKAVSHDADRAPVRGRFKG